MNMQQRAAASAQVPALALEKLFTEKELEEAGFGSRTKLRRDRMKGIGIPFIYVGSAVRYRASDVQAYLDANTVTRALQRPSDDPRRTAMSAQRRAQREARLPTANKE